MTTDRPDWRRRALVAGSVLAVVAWIKGVPYLVSSGTPDLAFVDLPGLSPFRWLTAAGATTSANTAFIGLDEPAKLDAVQRRLDSVVRSDPCRAMFGPVQEGPVPLAMFSDFGCPNCRIMDARIAALHARDPGRFRIVRHQLPILGVASGTASRAVLAADRQGAYREMHERLIRSPAVTDLSYVTAIASDIGLDPVAFASDLQSQQIAQALRLTEAIARVFGFYGTPAFAVGRTVFLGAVPTSTLEALIAQQSGSTPCQTV